MNKKTGLILILVLAAAIIAIGISRMGSQTQKPTVRVSANLPLTGSLATYGQSVREGAQMALEDLETSDRRAFTIDVDWQDNAGSPQTAVSIMQQQYLNPPDIYVSGVKPQCMAIKEQISERGTPHFVWIFDAVINADSMNNFRTWVSYKLEPPIYIGYAKSRNATRVAIIYVQLPHTVDEFNAYVIPGLREQGIADLFVEPFDFGKKEFKDIAVKVREFQPDLLILNGFQAELVGMVRALRPYGLIQDGNTIATYDMLDAAQILGADELEGICVVAPRFETRPDEANTAEWKRRFEERYNKPPLYTHAFAYDMIMAIAAAAADLELPAPSDRWIASLHAIATNGVTGPLRFDKDGDLVTPLEVGVYRGGRLVPLADQ